MPLPDIESTEKQTADAITYFENNINTIKWSRKNSGGPYSFIKAQTFSKEQESIFLISNIALGKGANGIVKLGKNIKTNELSAIKIQLLYSLNPALCHLKHTKETNMLYELKQLQGISTIMKEKGKKWKIRQATGPVSRYRKYNCKYYIFQTYKPGINLRNYLISKKPTESEIIQLLLKILNNLSELQAKNISHGDLKCENILVYQPENPNEELEVFIIDFGFAGKFNEHGIRVLPIKDYKFSKNYYLAPEIDHTKSFFLVMSSPVEPVIIKTIADWANHGYGFSCATSDLYSLIWSINVVCNYYTKQNNPPFISYLYNRVCNEKNMPFYRTTTEQLTEECQQQLAKLSLT